MESPAIWLNKSPKNSNSRITRDPRSNKRELRQGNNHYLATFPNIAFKIYQQTFEIQKIGHWEIFTRPSPVHVWACWRPGGNSRMKRSVILVMSEKIGDARRLGLNKGFWSRLGCSRQNATFLAVKVSFRMLYKK